MGSWDKHWLQIRTDVASIAAAIASIVSGGSLTTVQSSQYPVGATPVCVSADGAAGAAVSAVMPAGTALQKNYVLGYAVVVGTAATTNALTVSLKNDTAVVGIIDEAVAASPVGSKMNLSSSMPILVSTANKATSILVSAPGGTTVVHAMIWGYLL
jgi:hypothetical protein